LFTTRNESGQNIRHPAPNCKQKLTGKLGLDPSVRNYSIYFFDLHRLILYSAFYLIHRGRLSPPEAGRVPISRKALMLKKIISGGVPGVEKAALDAAIKLDIPHEGWTYKSRKTDDDALPQQYNVKEIANPSYFERLEKNINDSDGTVLLHYGQLISGSNAARDLSQKHNKPCLLLELNTCTHSQASSTIRKWMDNHGIEKIFFTGSKPVAAPNIHEEVILIIEGVCQVEREYEKFLGFKEEDDPPELIN